ncbi:hypothetical protein [Aquimarina mytili]|uniref:Uncharacterized protein n=1 Tax=Aquimarina mytili TaxID=874423 RepID=A0A937DBX8_9FLAO|nr:hypothetical protein [Aquimarina mytili]MBL0684326.1 hypothetical protein [Aquimarina mytili]
METIEKLISTKKEVKDFEQEVFNCLLIDPDLFDCCVNAHQGYAFLLRNWIRESYESGATVKEVVKKIKNSKLQLESIKIGKPLTLVA